MIAVLQYPEEENPDDFKAKVLLSSRKYGYALRSYMQTNIILHTDGAVSCKDNTVSFLRTTTLKSSSKRQLGE